MNPYWGKDAWEFLFLFFTRFPEWIRGHLASDEIQLFVLISIALSAAWTGTFLILKKMTMFANAISHTILLGIVLTYLLTRSFSSSDHFHLSMPLLIGASLLTACLTGLCIHLFVHRLNVAEDASIGLVFSSLFALGVLSVSILTRNSHIGTEVIMGNVDMLHRDDLKRALVILVFTLFFIELFFKEWCATAFDPSFSQSTGISVRSFHFFLTILASAVCIGSFRAVGVILVISFLVGPPLTARLWVHRVRSMIVLASFLGITASFLGVIVSRHLFSVHCVSLSTGGLVVFFIGVFYFLSLALLRLKDVAKKIFYAQPLQK
jgi:manganese/zinc/iron transport system permease protein